MAQQDYGAAQPIADVIKLMTKEDLMPPYVNKPLYLAAPFIAMTTAKSSFSKSASISRLRSESSTARTRGWCSVDMAFTPVWSG